MFQVAEANYTKIPEHLANTTFADCTNCLVIVINIMIFVINTSNDNNDSNDDNHSNDDNASNKNTLLRSL